jgi:two-component system response regulator GlrR
MNEIKLLILDLQSENGLGEASRDILNSDIHLSAEIQHLIVEDCELPSYCSSLIKKIPRSTNIIFLVSSPSLFKQSSTLISCLKKGMAPMPIVLICKESDPEKLFALLELGISDYIVPPLKIADTLPRIWRLINQTGHKTQTPPSSHKPELKQLIGESLSFVKEIKKIPTIAACDASVLLLGETGTGKELCARAIHYLSPRARKPFIPVNCGAIPLELFENELFGHERGAYTGATTASLGLLNEADGGTLFLDEIDCLPMLAQVKLLRFLQDKMYRSLGSATRSVANVRIVTATNLDIKKLVVEGKFRQDLYYRLNVISLIIPPLRERDGDTILLARHFLAKYAAIFNKRIVDFSADAIQELLRYEWPGNVRELEHIIERSVVFSVLPTIQGTDLSLLNAEPLARQESFRKAKSKMIEQFEKSYIQELLFMHQGNITRAAFAAQKHRRAFWQLIRKHHVDMKTFRPMNK